MKAISELIFNENAWSMIQDWIRNSQTHVHVLQNTRIDGEGVLYNLQISNKSTMGAIALECGGLVVDHGWLYILGSGHSEIYGSLIDNNHGSLFEEGFVVAYDKVGGIFAMNSGQFDRDSRNVYYFAPDTLVWEDTGKGYTDFLYWVMYGDLNQYYESFRWREWLEDVKKLTSDQGISIYPYLWTKQGRDIENTSKAAIPLKEIWEIQSDFRRTMIE
ncbi:DUF2625 family protein [Paenibacillus guangzhouensis]|uniref:DUF2625 family protein n=1 Tax=Paenibacillus guangzhouensis TaxID=1473112 RepID=UPI001266B85F|nr:DUF2625 family protein [Paenibacillus guangzhouensis]